MIMVLEKMSISAQILSYDSSSCWLTRIDLVFQQETVHGHMPSNGTHMTNFVHDFYLLL